MDDKGRILIVHNQGVVLPDQVQPEGIFNHILFGFVESAVIFNRFPPHKSVLMRDEIHDGQRHFGIQPDELGVGDGELLAFDLYKEISRHPDQVWPFPEFHGDLFQRGRI